jgi:hypothetical protein
MDARRRTRPTVLVCGDEPVMLTKPFGPVGLAAVVEEVLRT